MRDLTPATQHTISRAVDLYDRLPDLLTAMRNAPLPTIILTAGAVTIIGGIAATALTIVLATLLTIVAIAAAILATGLGIATIIGAVIVIIRIAETRPEKHHSLSVYELRKGR